MGGISLWLDVGNEGYSKHLKILNNNFILIHQPVLIRRVTHFLFKEAGKVLRIFKA